MKPGDRVKRLHSFNEGMYLGDTGVVTRIDGCNVYVKRDSNGVECGGHDPDRLEIINSNNMNLKEKFALVFKGEPERSFIKAGIMNSDESLTNDGQALFLAYLLQKNGADFKTTIVDPILAEKDNQ